METINVRGLGRVVPIVVTVLVSTAWGAGRPLSEVDRICSLRWVDRAKTDSRKCLGCHDGTIGSNSIYVEELGGDNSHPVEVSYARTQSARAGLLRPRATLPRELPLPGGNVTCTTCHDGYSTRPSRIAMPLEGSALCLACHAD